ncbi:MAG: hypothetical protein LWX09_10275, partial [Bacteroidia bacterium]|nr:hypothetical protein [Bacteroidia bacterium]
YIVAEYNPETYQTSPFYNTYNLEQRIFAFQEKASTRQEIWLYNFLLDSIRKRRNILMKLDSEFYSHLEKQADEESKNLHDREV